MAQVVEALKHVVHNKNCPCGCREKPAAPLVAPAIADGTLAIADGTSAIADGTADGTSIGCAAEGDGDAAQYHGPRERSNSERLTAATTNESAFDRRSGNNIYIYNNSNNNESAFDRRSGNVVMALYSDAYIVMAL